MEQHYQELMMIILRGEDTALNVFDYVKENNLWNWSTAEKIMLTNFGVAVAYYVNNETMSSWAELDALEDEVRESKNGMHRIVNVMNLIKKANADQQKMKTTAKSPFKAAVAAKLGVTL